MKHLSPRQKSFHAIAQRLEDALDKLQHVREGGAGLNVQWVLARGAEKSIRGALQLAYRGRSR